MSEHYLALTHPAWTIISVGAFNEYGHVHRQAKEMLRAAGISWYRTDRNGTITIGTTGIAGDGYTVHPSRGRADEDGTSDRASRQPQCIG